MKKIILFLIGLAGLPPLVLTKLAYAPDKDQKLGITRAHKTVAFAYSINPDLRFEAINKQFYATISQELNLLNRQFGKSKPIALSNNQKAQKLAPQTYKLLQSKISIIAARMGIDTSKITILIQPAVDRNTQKSDDVFNAYGQTIKRTTTKKTTRVKDGVNVNPQINRQTSCRHNLIITTELLKLLLWHEGSFQSSNKEELLDGVLAHELGHIFHAHMESNIECELQADKAGAKGLLNPLNLIDATDVLYFAGNLYSLLIAYNPKLHLDHEKILTVVTIIVSTLIRHNKGFGYYAHCSHAQYCSHSSQAACKAVTCILSKQASSNINLIISLLYDELKESCQTPLQNIKEEVVKPLQKINKVVALNSPDTHPDPKSRRQHLMLSLNHSA